MSAIYILSAVVLVSIGQVLQKKAAGEVDLGQGLSVAVVSLFRSPNFWRAAAAMVLGLIVWLLALTDMEVSRAYPILGLSFAVTAALSVALLGERVSSIRWLGICLISVGAATLAAS